MNEPEASCHTLRTLGWQLTPMVTEFLANFQKPANENNSHPQNLILGDLP